MTTTTVTNRPIADVSNADWLRIGGPATWWEGIADVSDFTTYIRSNTTTATVRVTIDPETIPADAVVISCYTRLWARAASNGATVKVGFNDRISTTMNIPNSGSFSFQSSASLAPTIAELLAGITMRLTANKITTEVAEAYIQTTYVTVPTLNVTAPTGTIAVTQPTVLWDTTADYPQERFQVKVFSSAQYGGVGFDEDTSTPLYDSSEQLGALESFVPTVNLPNGDTYRFYVRVAQKVGSVTQWSAWDFSTATVTVTPPPTPTLFVTPQSNQGRIKVRAHDTGTPTWEFGTIERSDDGGVIWTPVRSAERAPVSGTNLIVFDYETGNGQAVQYRAQAIIADPGGDIASDWSAVSGIESWSSDETWLKSLTLPTLNAEVLIVSVPTLRRRLPSSVIDIAGRSDPIVRSDVRHTVEGTVTFAALTTAELDALRALLDRSEVLLLQTPSSYGWGSKYIAIGDVDEDRVGPAVREERLVVCPFVEVVAPVGEVITFGTTWEDVIAAYATWTALETAQSSWAQLINAHL